MKKTIFIYVLFLIFSFFFFESGSNINAQGLGINEVVNVQIVPEVPKAGDTVYVYLTSYATDINAANITWKVNEKIIKKGIGEKVFNFVMGPDGQTTKLGIVISTKDAGTITKDIDLKPASVDLVWESHGFVPPFYKGKSLFAHEDRVTVIAFPHIIGQNGVELNPKSLIYKWKKDGSVVENLSGYGKDTFTFEGSLISRPVTISVEVSSESGQAYGYMTLEPVDPFVLLYKKDPIHGIQFQSALTRNISLSNTNEITIIGVPFFFDKEAQNRKEINNSWSINGKPVNNERSQWIQTFRPNEGTKGSSIISLSVENEDKILQTSSNTIKLIFNNENN
jgi:hypothetical protein